MSFWCLQFSQKTNENKIDLRYHSSKVKFFRSFFWKIEDTEKDISKLIDLYNKCTQSLLSIFKLALGLSRRFVNSMIFPAKNLVIFKPICTNQLLISLEKLERNTLCTGCFAWKKKNLAGLRTKTKRARRRY